MDVDMEAAQAGPATAPDDAWHPFYQLLPSYVSQSSLEQERRVLIARVAAALDCLQQLASAVDACHVRVQKHHFRCIESLFKLKHALPKSVHAGLVHVLVQLLWEQDGRQFVDPEMETRAVQTLQLLLDKWRSKRTRSERSEIVLQWRTAKRALDRVAFKGDRHIAPASQVVMQNLVSSMLKCVESARPFFVATERSSVAVELWTALAPTIREISSNECFQALGYLSYLSHVPAIEGAENAKDDAWNDVERLLPEWIRTWALISRCPEWDGHWFKFFSRIIKQYPTKSAIALQADLPFFFTKALDMLQLPSDLGKPSKNSHFPSAYALLHGSKALDEYAMRACVYLLANPNEDGVIAQPNQYLIDFLATLKPFFHPSNAANVADTLGMTIYYLSTLLAKRLGKEKAVGRVVLRVESCRPLFDSLLEIAFYGIYSKSRSIASKSMYLIKSLICVDPAHCSRPVLDEMIKALDPQALSQSHMAPAAISSMSIFLYHLMSGQHPDGAGLLFSTYLAPLLRLTLPGIDPNDEHKTHGTLSLYFYVLSWLPLVNDVAKGSNAGDCRVRLDSSRQVFRNMKMEVFVEPTEYDSEVDLKLWELGSFLEEWAMLLLDRCLEFIRTRANSHSGSVESDQASSGDSNGTGKSHDDILFDVLEMMGLLYAQLSPTLYTQALKKTVAFVSGVFFPSRVGGEVISMLVLNCLAANPAESFPLFMEVLLTKLRVVDGVVDVKNMAKSEKIWNLRIISGATMIADPSNSVLPKYRSHLTAILGHFLHNEEEKEVYEAAGKVLQGLLQSLVSIYPFEFRSLPPSEWQTAISPSTGMFQYLGTSWPWRRLNIQWHEPTHDEVAFAWQLLQEHLLGTLDSLDELRSRQDVNVRVWVPHLKRVSECLVGARNILIDVGNTDGSLWQSSLPLLAQACGEDKQLYDTIASLKAQIMNRVLETVSFWRTSGTHGVIENQVWSLLLQIMKRLLVWRGSHLEGHHADEKQNVFAKITTLDVVSHQMRKTRSSYFPRDAMEETPLASRNEMIERVLFFYGKRHVQEHFELAYLVLSDQSTTGQETRTRYEAILGAIEDLMKSPYSEIRHEASGVMLDCAKLYAKWVYSRVPRAIEALEGQITDAEGVIKEETVTGALEFLNRPFVLGHIWKKRRTLVVRLMKALLASNTTVLAKVEGEASKATLVIQLQTFFLGVLANWRYVREETQSGAIFDELLNATPARSEHWRMQLMHMVTFFPLLQPAEMPVRVDLWQMIVKHLHHEVLPVRQVALLIFAQLVKLYAEKAGEDSTPNGIHALLCSDDVLTTVVEAIVQNHRSSHRFSASADGQHPNSAPSNWSFGITEVIRYLSNSFGSYPRPRPLSSVRLLYVSAYAFKIRIAHIKLAQQLSQLDPNRVFDGAVLTALDDLTGRLDAKQADEDRQSAFLTLAEWMGGMLRALLKAKDGAPGRVAAVKTLLVKILPNVNHSLIDPWVQMLYYVSHPRRNQQALAFDRLKPIVEYLLEQLELSFAHATMEDYSLQVKWLTLVEPLLVHMSPQQVGTSAVATAMRKAVLKVLDEHALSHQYNMVRDRAARVLFLLGASSATDELEPSLQLQKLHTLSNVDSPASSSTQDEEDTAQNAKETALHWLLNAERHGDTREFAQVMDALLPIALLTQSHPKVELMQLAKYAVDATALSERFLHAPDDATGAGRLETVLTILQRFATHDIWKTRAAVLRFVTSFASSHWLFFAAPQQAQVQTLVMTFLVDEQREVQEMAKYSLRSLIHYMRAAVVAELATQLVTQAASARTLHPKLMRRLQKQQQDAASEDELSKTKDRIKKNERKMATSVLGMSAIVLASPHSVPSYVPPLFVELGRYLYIKQTTPMVSYLEKSAQDTLLDFKRTHQDTWRDIKTSFTSEQREVFEDMLLAPSYYT